VIFMDPVFERRTLYCELKATRPYPGVEPIIFPFSSLGKMMGADFDYLEVEK
jgi:hypothetical protein